MEEAEVSKAVDKLVEVEKKLDEVGAMAERFRRELISFAEKEAEQLKSSIISDVSTEQERLMQVEKEEAERRAAEIMRQGDEQAEKTRRAVEDRFEEAVRLVVNMLLGRDKGP